MAHIVSVEVVRQRAQRAAADGQALHEAQPYPDHTDAGQLFAREFEAALAPQHQRPPLDAVELRTVTAGLHGDFAQLPGRIERAAHGPLAQYASTCTALLESLAERGGRMAERGADIAGKADGHSADTGLMEQAWPRK